MAMPFECVNQDQWVRTHYQRVCEWCREPIRFDEPTAMLTDNGTCWRLHLQCGYDWQANKRDQIIDNCRENDRLAREVRSLNTPTRHSGAMRESEA